MLSLRVSSCRHVRKVLVLLCATLAISLSLLVVQLRVHEDDFLLESRDLSLGLVLVEGLLGHELSAQILHLQRELSLDSLILFPHDVTPDHVQLIENARDTRLRHETVPLLVVILDLVDFLDGFGRDPLVGITLLLDHARLRLVQFDTESVTYLGN